jgi:hypothetical protein
MYSVTEPSSTVVNACTSEKSLEGRNNNNHNTSFNVAWGGKEDKDNPRNFGIVRKWVIVIVVSLSSTCVLVLQPKASVNGRLVNRHNRTCTSSLYTTTYGQMTKELHCSELVATIGLSLFIFGMGSGPLFVGPLSEVSLKQVNTRLY